MKTSKKKLSERMDGPTDVRTSVRASRRMVGRINEQTDGQTSFFHWSFSAVVVFLLLSLLS